jgi:hypothetical protein
MTAATNYAPEAMSAVLTMMLRISISSLLAIPGRDELRNLTKSRSKCRHKKCLVYKGHILTESAKIKLCKVLRVDQRRNTYTKRLGLKLKGIGTRDIPVIPAILMLSASS